MQDRTVEEFDEIIYDDESPALVLFHRDGCHVCEEIAPRLEELEDEYRGQVEFLSINVEENNVFARFGLMGVPQVLLFRDGNLSKRISGKKSQEEYQDAIENIL